jgi:tRNA pseudouridine32 synthase / 23S rRNA pseudouridine746 synthase
MDARQRQIRVLFENDELIAVDKPEGLASIPERNPATISLLKLLTAARGQKLYVVHRLDKQVSGVILFAKTPETHHRLNQMFEQRRMYKTYIAWVHGEIAADRGVIDMPLRRCGSGRMAEDRQCGKPCLTEFEVEQRSVGFTCVRVHPATGRKHQIRTHFFSIGHPIVGDTLYGDRRVQKTFPRVMLHALSLRFKLPDAGEIFIESRLPDAFLKLTADPCTPEITRPPNTSC